MLKAKENAQDLCKDLQACLRVSIDTGIATNTKYTKQVFRGNSSAGTVKSCVPLLLRAKTNLGQMNTRFSEARIVQPLIRPAPVVQVLELHKLPGRGSEHAVNERGLHTSLEQSYAQARNCLAQTNRQLDISRSRTALFERAKKDLAREAEKSLRAQRAVRREIVEHVLSNTAIVVPPLGEGEGGVDALGVMQRAVQALRQIVKQINHEANGDAEDDELPGYQYIFGNT